MPTSDEAFEAALNHEDDLGAVIRVHLHIEHHVNQLLELLVPFPEDLKSVKLDYDNRVKLLSALRIKPESTKVLSALGTMRNKFAHNLNYKLDKSNVKNLYETIGSSDKEILQRVYSNLRKKDEHKDLEPFKSLLPKEQFIVIAVLIRRMVLRMINEVENPV